MNTIHYEKILWKSMKVKFVYSEKATKFCEISFLLLSTVHPDKSKVEISQNFVAFSEYMNFNSYVFPSVLIFFQNEQEICNI